MRFEMLEAVPMMIFEKESAMLVNSRVTDLSWRFCVRQFQRSRAEGRSDQTLRKGFNLVA